MKNAQLKLALVLAMLLASPVCNAEILNDIHVQVNEKVDTLVGMLANEKWTVSSTGHPYKYKAVQAGRTIELDFSSQQKIGDSLSYLFPEHIFVTFSFMNVIPNAVAYINNQKYVSISKSGNYDGNRNFFQTKPGIHVIRLNKSQSIVEETEVNIISDDNVLCAGNNHMVCKAGSH